MKTLISIFAIASAVSALSVFPGCDEVHQGGGASHVSGHNYALGRYHATAQQIGVARERARSYYARMSPAKQKKASENGVRYLAVRTLDPSPDQLAEIKRRSAAGATGGLSVGYGGTSISGPAPQAGAERARWHCVMIWDTHVEDVVESDCYAVTALPAQGAIVHFDTYAAEYVGSGTD